MAHDGNNERRALRCANTGNRQPPAIGPPGRRFAPFLRRGFLTELPHANIQAALAPCPNDLSPPSVPPRSRHISGAESRGDGTGASSSDRVSDVTKFPIWDPMYINSSQPIKMDERSAGKMWAPLKVAILEIQTKRSTEHPFDQLYRNAYHMVLFKYGGNIYKGFNDITSAYLEKGAQDRVVKSLHTNFLSVLNQVWREEQRSLVLLSDILMYVDRVYVPKYSLLSIYQLGLKLFRKHIIRHPPIQKMLRSTLLSMVMAERNGQSINNGEIRRTCEMLMCLSNKTRSVYESEFESHFLRLSVSYFQTKAEEFLKENNAGLYIKQVELLIREESARAKLNCDKETIPRLINVLKAELIRKHMKKIVELENSGIVFMMRNVKIEDLSCTYKLLCHLENEGLKILVDTVSNFLRSEGQAIVELDERDAGANPVTFVRNLLDLKDRFDYFVENAFENDRAVQKVIAADFEYLLNLNEKSPEYLSIYIDDKLRKGLKGLTEDEFSELLDKGMVLFRFLSDKDVFERYYKNHLARRLLLNKTAAIQHEMDMITKLKSECGYQFTARLESMFNDVKASAQETDEFQKHIQQNQVAINNIDFSVDVLTTGFWPISILSQFCNIPTVPRKVFDEFTSYYMSVHTGRKIELQPHLGSADIMGIFSPRKNENQLRNHILSVSTYQMCILLLFNTRDAWSYAELEQQTNMPSVDLQRTMQSLTAGKASQRILVRSTAIRQPAKDKHIQPNDIFSINEAFSSKFNRVKVHTVGNRGDTENDGRELRVKVDDGRKLEIEAAIVRVMKSRQTLHHNLLVADVISQLQGRFIPSQCMIKKRIEELIDREYIKRTPSDRRTYIYLAA